MEVFLRGFPEAQMPLAVLDTSAPTVHESTEGPGDIVTKSGLVDPAEPTVVIVDPAEPTDVAFDPEEPTGKRKKGKRLTEEDRKIVEARLKEKAPMKNIAKEVGITETWLSKEINKNCSPGKEYCAAVAQKKSHQRIIDAHKKSGEAQSCPMRRNNPPLYAEICRRLRDGEQPTAILRALQKDHPKLSIGTIGRVKKYYKAHY